MKVFVVKSKAQDRLNHKSLNLFSLTGSVTFFCNFKNSVDQIAVEIINFSN